MKRIMLLWLLCVMTCIGVNAQTLDGATIKSVGGAVSSVESLEDGGFYLMYNVGHATYLNEPDNYNLWLNYHSASFVGSSSASDLNYVVQLQKVGDKWKIRLESGLYVPALLHGGGMSSSATAELFTVTLLGTGTDGDGCFSFQGTSNSYQLNGNGNGSGADAAGSLTGWDYSSSVSGNGSYKLYPVEFNESFVTYIVPDIAGTGTCEILGGFVDGTTPDIDYFNVTSSTKRASAATGNEVYDVTGTWNLPFELNKVYRLKMRLRGIEGDNTEGNKCESFYYDSAASATDGQIGVRKSTAGDDPTAFIKEYLWYFKAGEGATVTLHNLVLGDAQGVAGTLPTSTGSTKCLLSATPVAFRVVENPGAEESGDLDGFSLQAPGAICCLNDISGKLGLWRNPNSPTDAGSRFALIDISEEIGTIDSYSAPSENLYLGEEFCFNEEKKATAAADPSVENVNDLFVPVFKDAVDCSKYYRLTFIRAYNSAGTITATGYAGKDGEIAAEDSPRAVETTAKGDFSVSQLWQFEESTDGNGKYTLRNANANGYYLGAPDGSARESKTQITTATQADGVQLNPIVKEAAAGRWVLQLPQLSYLPGDDPYYFCSSEAGSNITCWNKFDDAGAPIEIQEVTSVPVSIGTTGYATLCLPFAVSVPEGVTAYTVSEVMESGDVKYVELVDVPNGQIPAKTGVILVADEKPEAATPFDFTILTDEEVAAISGNLLEGVTLTRRGYDADNHYGLKAVNGEAVLARNAADIDVPSNKAVLPAAQVPTGDANVLRLRPSEGSQTGIGSVETVAQEEVRFYDLNGRRVLRPSKGIYVTGDGRKVFVK